MATKRDCIVCDGTGHVRDEVTREAEQCDACNNASGGRIEIGSEHMTQSRGARVEVVRVQVVALVTAAGEPEYLVRRVDGLPFAGPIRAKVVTRKATQLSPPKSRGGTRPGAGRKPSPDARRHATTVRLTADVQHAMSLAAVRAGMSDGDFIAQLVAAAVGK